MKAEQETKYGIVANLLVQAGTADATAIAGAIEIQAAKGGTLPKILSALGLADEEAACAAIAAGLRLDYITPDAVSGLGEVEWEAHSTADAARGGALPPVIRVVNMILSDAARAGASDVHVEPQEGHLLVRRRIDGLLEDVMRIQRDLQNAITSRLKIISGMGAQAIGAGWPCTS